MENFKLFLRHPILYTYVRWYLWNVEFNEAIEELQTKIKKMFDK